MATINLDTSTFFEITQFQGQPVKIEWDHFENNGTTPVNLTGIFKMVISSDERGDNVILTSTLTTISNKLIINITKVQTLAMAPNLYFFGIRNDNGADSYQAYIGTIKIKPNPAKQ